MVGLLPSKGAVGQGQQTACTVSEMRKKIGQIFSETLQVQDRQPPTCTGGGTGKVPATGDEGLVHLPDLLSREACCLPRAQVWDVTETAEAFPTLGLLPLLLFHMGTNSIARVTLRILSVTTWLCDHVSKPLGPK